MQEQISEHNSPRKAWVAALMSLALPGLGQLYNGEFNKAIWVFLVFAITAIPLIIVIALLLPATLTLLLIIVATALTQGIWIWSIFDAWRVANRLQIYRTQAWQTSGVYTLLFLLCATVILPATLLWVRNHLAQPFYLPSASMAPSLLRGDFVFANMNYNCPQCLTSVARGDVAIFVYPDNRTQHYVKRVIGLPGDTVAIVGNTVSVNGTQLNNEDQPNVERINNRSWTVQWMVNSKDRYEITVEPGHAFVLGDNRSRSNDSRRFGQVPLSDVVGKVRQIWFSKGVDGVRWSRIGLLVN